MAGAAQAFETAMAAQVSQASQASAAAIGGGGSADEKASKRGRDLRLALKIALPTAIAIAAILALGSALDRHESRPLWLQGLPIPAGDPEPFVRGFAEIWLETEVSLDAGSLVTRASRRDLGAEVDVEATLAAVRVARGQAPLHHRIAALLTDSEEDDHLALVRSIDLEATRHFATMLRRRAEVRPIASAIRHRSRPSRRGRPGLSLGLMATQERLTRALEREELVIHLPAHPIDPPAAPTASYGTAVYTEVVSAHQTRYALHSGRTHNIELAARLLDGARIAPGQTLSFNQVVGERSFIRGFMPATEIAGGRLVDGIGGGVCQVAATLMAAAFLGGFEIVEHHPHSRNIRYIAAGLDSAVSWPNHDLRVLNPHPFHVRVIARAHQGILRVELRGAQRGPRVEWNTRIVRRIRRRTESTTDTGLPMGSESIEDEGNDGQVIERRRTIYWPEGPEEDVATLHYPAISRLVRRGPG